MSKGWKDSTRQSRLPKNWSTIRLRILRRDNYRCQWQGCGADATDVDHIKPNDDDSDANLQSLCGVHHASKSGREGAAARAKRLAHLRALTKRPTEQLPGTIPVHQRQPTGNKGW